MVFYNLLFQSQHKLANTVLKAVLILSMLLVHKQAHKWNKASLASASTHSSAKWKSTQVIETKRSIQASEQMAEYAGHGDSVSVEPAFIFTLGVVLEFPHPLKNDSIS